MATLTFNTASAVDAAPKAAPAASAKPSFFSRFVQAVMASNQRRADIAIRQHLALIGEPRERHDYALLPFRGE